MERERDKVKRIAKAVKGFATLIAVCDILIVLCGLAIYAVMSLVFDKTTIAVTDLPSALVAGIAEGTQDIPVARVFAAYIPTFAAIFLGIFFFWQLRKTAIGLIENDGRLFYHGSHRQFFILAVMGFAINAVQNGLYFGLKIFLAAENMPKNFDNSHLVVSIMLFALAFTVYYGEKFAENSGRATVAVPGEIDCGDGSPEKENEQ